MENRSIGACAPVATLVLHVIFGAVLGGTYRHPGSRKAASRETA